MQRAGYVQENGLETDNDGGPCLISTSCSWPRDLDSGQAARYMTGQYTATARVGMHYRGTARHQNTPSSVPGDRCT